MSDAGSPLTIITGAAGGMGRAIANAFARKGRPLILSDLHREPLEAVAQTLRDASIDLVSGDLTADDYPDRLIAALKERRIGALVHTAGVSPSMADGRRFSRSTSPQPSSSDRTRHEMTFRCGSGHV